MNKTIVYDHSNESFKVAFFTWQCLLRFKRFFLAFKTTDNENPTMWTQWSNVGHVHGEQLLTAARQFPAQNLRKKIDSLKTRLLGIKTFAHAQMFDRWIYFVSLWVPLWVPFTTLQTLVLTFEFVVQNLMNDHSNESFWAVHSCTTIYEAVQGDSNFLVCLWHTHTLGIMPYKNVHNLKF